jgi:hypothetical protein
LKTFFIGQCLFRFANVYHRWTRENQQANVDQTALREGLLDLRTRPAAAPVAADLSMAVGRLKERSAQQIEAMIAMGYDQSEIAELWNTTLRAIESKLYRHRRGARGKARFHR